MSTPFTAENLALLGFRETTAPAKAIPFQEKQIAFKDRYGRLRRYTCGRFETLEQFKELYDTLKPDQPAA